MLAKVITFFTRDIWRIPLKKLSPGKSFLIRHTRIALLAFRRYDEDQCLLRASALTFYSLLAVVPVIAVAFGIAKGFGFEKILEKQLTEKIPAQQDLLMHMISFASNLLEKTKGGLVAGIGVALLFWSVVKVLATIEHSFNDIWGIKSARPLVRKISDYLSVIFICPILLIIASSVTVFVSTEVRLIIERTALLGAVSQYLFLLLNFLPYCVLWVLFSFIYIFMPNTKVRFRSGLLAGIVAGTVYQAVQWIYVTFQIGVAKSNAIYGSFAALPLFLVWLQMSWLIVLAGAEVSFAHQNIDLYEFEPDCLRVSPAFKKLVTLQIVRQVVKNFEENKAPYTAVEIAQQLEIPIRLVRQIAYELEECGIIDEVTTPAHKESAFQPAHDPHILTIQYVLSALEVKGVSDIPIAQTAGLQALSASLREMAVAVEQSPANRLLKDI